MRALARTATRHSIADPLKPQAQGRLWPTSTQTVLPAEGGLMQNKLRTRNR